jgi:protein O-mannose beta-1,4-N-acetylglucosaminyltransferase
LGSFSFISDSGRNAPLEDTRRDETFLGDSGDASSAAANPAAAGGKGEAVPAKDDDAGPAAGLLPPVSSEEAANSTQESGEKAITQPPTANLLGLVSLIEAK